MRGQADTKGHKEKAVIASEPYFGERGNLLVQHT